MVGNKDIYSKYWCATWKWGSVEVLVSLANPSVARDYRGICHRQSRPFHERPQIRHPRGSSGFLGVAAIGFYLTERGHGGPRVRAELGWTGGPRGYPISSISDFGVAIPALDFFWKA